MKTLSGIALIAALVAANPAVAECNDRTGPNVVTEASASAVAQPRVERLSGSTARSGPNIVGDAVAGIEKPRGNGTPRATRPTGEAVPCVKCVAI